MRFGGRSGGSALLGRVSEVPGLRRDRGAFLGKGHAMIRVHKTRGSSGGKRLALPAPAEKILRGLPKEKGNPHDSPGRAKGESLTRNGRHKT
jgi:hypothetical protein